MTDRQKLRRIVALGTVETHADAVRQCSQPGEAAVVKRGVLRSLVLNCPCGCGDVLTINLDKRAGKAWRMYQRSKGISLYPSVWRDSGCESHFVIWNSHVSWLDTFEWQESTDDLTRTQRRVLERLEFGTFAHFVDIADELGEIPWMILYTCRDLAHAGLVQERAGDDTGWFRRTDAGGQVVKR